MKTWGALAAVFALGALHLHLESSIPADGEELSSPPDFIRLVFSEPVDTAMARASLEGGEGSLSLALSPDTGDPRSLVADVPPLPAGGYRILWRVVSADGHPVTGEITFSIRADRASGTGPEVAGDTTGRDDAVRGTGASGEIPWSHDEPSVRVGGGAPLAPSLLRGAGLAALLGVTGLLLMLSGAGGGSSTRELRTAIWLSLAAATLLLVHGLAWSAWFAGSAWPSPATIGPALGTAAGKLEASRAGLTVLMAGALTLARRPRLAAVLGVGAIVVSGAVGHPAAADAAWPVALKAVHLLAVSIWLGGLTCIVLGDASEPSFPRRARRVSRWALWAVVAIAVTGVPLTLGFLPGLDALLGSAYGRLVLVKAAGLGVLIAFGAYHRFRLVPSLGEAGTAARLIGSVRRERVVLIAVLLVAGFLAYTPLPPGAP